MLPEAILTAAATESSSGGAPEAGSRLPSFLDRASALVAGPGLSVSPLANRILKQLLEERKERKLPCVLDADALNILARERELLGELDERMILTPHMGEMARLVGKSVAALKEDPIGAAKSFHETYGAVCVLKDARTVVASGKGIYVNLSGNDGMATGGSGDVLSGILGGLLAGGMEPADAAETGVYLHGLAGDAAASRLGRRSMLAGDILEEVAGVFRGWE